MMTNLIILALLSAKGDGPNAPVNGYFMVTCTGLGRLRRFRRGCGIRPDMAACPEWIGPASIAGPPPARYPLPGRPAWTG
jgi:hypothetical protein